MLVAMAWAIRQDVRRCVAWVRDEAGANTVEYVLTIGVIITLIALAVDVASKVLPAGALLAV